MLLIARNKNASKIGLVRKSIIVIWLGIRDEYQTLIGLTEKKNEEVTDK